jgi:hypothetical protein
MNIENLVKETKAKFDHNLAKHYLKEKYQSKLIFANQGGLWKADQSLLSLLIVSESKELVLLDLHENPIKVNRTELYEKTLDLYNETMSAWHEEWVALQRQR